MCAMGKKIISQGSGRWCGIEFRYQTLKTLMCSFLASIAYTNNRSKKREPLMPKTTGENEKEEPKKACLLYAVCPVSLAHFYILNHCIKMDTVPLILTNFLSSILIQMQTNALQRSNCLIYL